MKKSVLLVAIFTLVFSALMLAACGGGSSSSADVSDSKYVGTWKATTISLADESDDMSDLEWTLVLNDDGTGTTSAFDEESGETETTEFTWELTDKGFKTKGDMKLEFADDGDNIKTTMFGADMTFEKQ